ncbi:hypothetical protein BX600DRAFT_515437 [Xylariales sp. PMI_506]|nr:hypothetical protein BX600DRAFT_515437 [Xylariales sp. PMI_506]
MTTISLLNVFSGPDSLKKYFKSDQQPPVSLVEIAEKLIHSNIKALSAINMLLHDPSAAKSPSNDDMAAFTSYKAALDRVREFQFFGMQVALYGGPTYTKTTDPRKSVEWARRMPHKNLAVKLPRAVLDIC